MIIIARMHIHTRLACTETRFHTCRVHASKSASGAHAAFFKAPSLQPPTPKPPTANSQNLTQKRYIEPNRQCFKFHMSNLKPNPPFATETIRQFRTSCPSQKLTMFPHVQVRLWRVCCTPRSSKPTTSNAKANQYWNFRNCFRNNSEMSELWMYVHTKALINSCSNHKTKA